MSGEREESVAQGTEASERRGSAWRRWAPLVLGSWLLAVLLWLLSRQSEGLAAWAAACVFAALCLHCWFLTRWWSVVAAIVVAACLVVALPQFDLVRLLPLMVVLAGGAVATWQFSRRWSRRGDALADAERANAELRERVQAARARCEALEARLTEAERLAAVGTMAAQIAHQLRNPLTSVQLYIQLLEEDLRKAEAGAPEEAFELVALVLKELKLLVEITDNYLQYARLPEVERSPLDVNRAVGELVRFLKPECSRRGIHLTTRFAPSVPTVLADRRLVRLAMINILKNAVEAMEEGGRLRVATAHENGAVEVRVSDTGGGILESELDRIFEPFYTTKDSGSGLGLALSRQIIEKHGGSLACQSLPGVGTTFVVKLPVGE